MQVIAARWDFRMWVGLVGSQVIGWMGWDLVGEDWSSLFRRSIWASSVMIWDQVQVVSSSSSLNVECLCTSGS